MLAQITFRHDIFRQVEGLLMDQSCVPFQDELPGTLERNPRRKGNDACSFSTQGKILVPICFATYPLVLLDSGNN